MGWLWRKYIRVGLVPQAIIAIVVCALVTAGFVGWLLVVHGRSLGETPRTAAELLLNDPSDIVPESLKQAYEATLLLVVAIWQALFLARVLTRPHHYVFSRRMALYPRNPLKSAASHERPILVFRFLNDGDVDLYEVSISATLRVYHPGRATYQHFQCRVVNDLIPVFRRGMPFWIAIETGTVHVRSNDAANPLDSCHLIQAEGPDDQHMRTITTDYASRITAEHGLDRSAFALIVYVRGQDVAMNQTKAAVQHYDLLSLTPGFFKSIDARKDSERLPRTHKYKYFRQSDIDRSFHVIEQPVEGQP